MFSKILNWIKTHKLSTFLILVIAYFLFGQRASNLVRYSSIGDSYSMVDSEIYPMGVSGGMGKGLISPRIGNVAPSLSQERKVIINSNFSLLVKNVNSFVSSIKAKALESGGFLVDTRINRDEMAETATIQVRVPSNMLEEFSQYLRSLSVKVVYENIVGNDITDQYTDYENRIASLESAKEKLEDIMDKAITAQDILIIQQNIFQVQDQIDSYKGQLDYMDKSSMTSLVTITISTDELGLPYYPVQSWRPDVVFKQAIRSLFGFLISVGSLGIWFAVFSPIIALVIVIIMLVRKRKIKSTGTKKS